MAIGTRHEMTPGCSASTPKKDLILRLGVRVFYRRVVFKITPKPTTLRPMPLSSPQTNVAIALPGDGAVLLLSRDELVALTGTVQPARQRCWLDARGWPYAEAFGRGSHPRVARFVFTEKMTGRDSCQQAATPRFDALDRLARTA